MYKASLLFLGECIMNKAMGLKSLHDPKYDEFDKLHVDEKSVVILPNKVDYSYDYPLPDDQGQLGTCVAFASAKIFDFYHKKHAGVTDLVSARAIYAQAKSQFEQGDTQDDGLNVSDGLGAIHEYYVFEKDYSSFPDDSEADFAAYLKIAPKELQHTDFIVRKFFTVNPTVADMRRALFKNGPLLIGLAWPNSWFNVESDGKLPAPDSSAGGHCVSIVGYDDTIENLDGTKGAFHVINNWTTQWANGGYAWMPYSLEGSDFFPTDIFTVLA